MLDATSSHQLLRQALRHPRGRYSAERAAQLAGVPTSTVYDWQRSKIYVPDFYGSKPLAWSYRDLVYLRLLAWLRQLKMPRPVAAERVSDLKAHVASGNEVRYLRATSRSMVFDNEQSDRVSGENLLPFTELSDLLSVFDLLDPVEELGNQRLWGPDLITPSTHTYISPWVLGGDVCVESTRIPTAVIFALRSERGLTTNQIVELYPGLNDEAADDALALEERLRGGHRQFA